MIRVEKRAVKWAAEGMVKSVYNIIAEYSMTWRIRKLRGICRYPAEGTGFMPVNQGGDADFIIRPWRSICFAKDF